MKKIKCSHGSWHDYQKKKKYTKQPTVVVLHWNKNSKRRNTSFADENASSVTRSLCSIWMCSEKERLRERESVAFELRWSPWTVKFKRKCKYSVHRIGTHAPDSLCACVAYQFVSGQNIIVARTHIHPVLCHHSFDNNRLSKSFCARKATASIFAFLFSSHFFSFSICFCAHKNLNRITSRHMLVHSITNYYSISLNTCDSWVFAWRDEIWTTDREQSWEQSGEMRDV